MKRYQRILVCIDKPERDYRMLGYTGAICKAAETKQVHLLHVERPAEPELDEAAAPVSVKITPETLSPDYSWCSRRS